MRLAAGVKVCDGGRVLVGGGTVLYLTPAAAALVAGAVERAGSLDEADGSVARSLVGLLLDRGLADPVWDDPPPADAEVADVTVVVPVHDRTAGLDRLLAALPPGLPVVVVDDASGDPAAVATVAATYGARLVRHRANRGPAAARNTGLREVGTAYVVFCDSDVVPQAGWLGTLSRHLEDPAVAVAAPRIQGAAGRGRTWIERYEQARSSLDLGAAPAAVRVHGPVSYVPSACLLARVAALGDGFDETMRVAEDVDLVWRLLGQGRRVRYEPAAVVRHDHRVETGQWLRRKAFYGTGAALLATRHGGAVAPMVLAPWSGVLAGALLAQRRWSLPVAAAATGFATAGIARKLGRSRRPLLTAATLTLEGAVAAVWQTGSALTRHYWPLAAAAGVRSAPARRALVLAEVALAVLEHRRTRPDLDLPRFAVARALDDAAYGAGLWWGAIRARSGRALVPAWRRSGPARQSVENGR